MPSIQYFQKTESVKNNFSLKPVLFGLITSALISLLLIIISATAFLYSGLSQQFIPVFSKLILAVSVFLGGMIAGMKSKITGWLYGLITGILFLLLLLAINLVLGIGVSYSGYLYIVFSVCAVVGSIGGIVGINLKLKKKH